MSECAFRRADRNNDRRDIPNHGFTWPIYIFAGLIIAMARWVAEDETCIPIESRETGRQQGLEAAPLAPQHLERRQ